MKRRTQRGMMRMVSKGLLKKKESLLKLLEKRKIEAKLVVENNALMAKIQSLEKELKEDKYSDLKKRGKGFMKGLGRVWDKVSEIADNMPDAETVINGTTHPKKKKTKKKKGVVRGKQ